MIASVRGRVLDVQLAQCVIEVGGVGIAVQATPHALASLRRGEEGFLHTALIVREDSLTLYGFDTAAAREAFGVVQGVSGIGPRIALAVVATLGAEGLAAAIAAEDIKAIQKVPGVGKRTAERMVLDLRDKVAALGLPQELGAGSDTETNTVHSAAGASRIGAEVTEALEGLGFPAKEAARAAETATANNPEADAAAVLRAALAALGPGR